MYGSFCRKRPMSSGFFDGKRLLVYTRHHVTNKVCCSRLYFLRKEPPFSRMATKALWSGGLFLFLFRGCKKNLIRGLLTERLIFALLRRKWCFLITELFSRQKRPYILELFRRKEANKMMLQMEFMVTELCLQREPFFGKRALSFWALFTQIGIYEERPIIYEKRPMWLYSHK